MGEEPMNRILPKELIKEYLEGKKVIILSKKYGIEYNTLYFILGRMGIRRKEMKGGYRGAYKRKNE